MPAMNSDGKKNSAPVIQAFVVSGASAAITSPRLNRAAAPSASTSSRPGTFPGSAMPSAAAPTASTSRKAPAAIARAIASWANSSAAGCAGVVERRRSTPRAR
jgi:hypothetical protein